MSKQLAYPRRKRLHWKEASIGGLYARASGNTYFIRRANLAGYTGYDLLINDNRVTTLNTILDVQQYAADHARLTKTANDNPLSNPISSKAIWGIGLGALAVVGVGLGIYFYTRPAAAAATTTPTVPPKVTPPSGGQFVFKAGHRYSIDFTTGAVPTFQQLHDLGQALLAVTAFTLVSAPNANSSAVVVDCTKDVDLTSSLSSYPISVSEVQSPIQGGVHNPGGPHIGPVFTP